MPGSSSERLQREGKAATGAPASAPGSSRALNTRTVPLGRVSCRSPSWRAGGRRGPSWTVPSVAVGCQGFVRPAPACPACAAARGAVAGAAGAGTSEFGCASGRTGTSASPGCGACSSGPSPPVAVSCPVPRAGSGREPWGGGVCPSAARKSMIL